ncbi:hypothetical protein ACIO1C_24070 [Streptomyces sp. NPDC087420]|uniref:hypothetical protein n=1 Tax=Streptomyces sp. NPDC087420 TaxID=3365785 RepID=UPI0038349E19
MAKERVTVCLAPCEPVDLQEAIGAAMAPYFYYPEERPDPDWVGEWDYWYVSGAGCEFAVRAGCEGDPRIVREEGPEAVDRPPLPPDRCHGGPRGLLDFETDRAEVAEEASRAWSEWQEFADGCPVSLAQGHFLQRTYDDPVGYPQKRALDDFSHQPVIRALHARPELEERFSGDPVGRFGQRRELYVEARVAHVLPTTALLTLDGRWTEAATHEHRRWASTYLDALPADTMVVRVLYHS